jgi:hypothetical protein
MKSVQLKKPIITPTNALSMLAFFHKQAHPLKEKKPGEQWIYTPLLYLDKTTENFVKKKISEVIVGAAATAKLKLGKKDLETFATAAVTNIQTGLDESIMFFSRQVKYSMRNGIEAELRAQVPSYSKTVTDIDLEPISTPDNTHSLQIFMALNSDVSLEDANNLAAVRFTLEDSFNRWLLDGPYRFPNMMQSEKSHLISKAIERTLEDLATSLRSTVLAVAGRLESEIRAAVPKGAG